jgi:hypothetical protein
MLLVSTVILSSFTSRMAYIIIIISLKPSSVVGYFCQLVRIVLHELYKFWNHTVLEYECLRCVFRALYLCKYG